MGRGPDRGRPTRGWTRSCWRTVTAATSSTATATGRSRRSWRTSTPAGTRSTSPSRTGRTTSTSAPWCAPPTRSSRPRCTSSATAAGIVAGPWSPTATSTCGTTRRWTTCSRGRRRRAIPVLGVDNLPGSVPLEGYALPRECVLLFGQESVGLSDQARAAAVDVLHIAQFGSTRSINAGAAAAIAMHAGSPSTRADAPARAAPRISAPGCPRDQWPRRRRGVSCQNRCDTPLSTRRRCCRWPSPPPRSTPR